MTKWDEEVKPGTRYMCHRRLQEAFAYGEEAMKTLKEMGNMVATPDNYDRDTSEVESKNNYSPNQIAFIGVTDRMFDLYSRKNRDYGDSFTKSLDEDGLIVSKIRMGDKMNRFATLIKHDFHAVNDESLIDTLFDLANYAVMTIDYIERDIETTSTILYADNKPYGHILDNGEFIPNEEVDLSETNINRR